MAVVAISREFGSGEVEFSNLLADRLGYWLFDRILINLAAEELEVHPDLVQAVDERAEPTGIARVFERIFRSSPRRSAADTRVLLIDPRAPGGFYSVSSEPEGEKKVQTRSVSAAVRTVIKELAMRGNVIIVGRGAGFLLSDRPDVLSLRLVAPEEKRVARICQKFGVSEEMARVAIRRTDGERGRFLYQQYGVDWTDPSVYHVVLNTDRIGIEGAVQIAAAAVAGLEAKSLA